MQLVPLRLGVGGVARVVPLPVLRDVERAMLRRDAALGLGHVAVPGRRRELQPRGMGQGMATSPGGRVPPFATRPSQVFPFVTHPASLARTPKRLIREEAKAVRACRPL